MGIDSEEGSILRSRSTYEDADLRQDPHGQDHHPWGGVLGHHRQCQEQDPRQGGHSAGPAALDLRWQAARGRPYPLGLQHPEGVHPSLGPAPARLWPRSVRRRCTLRPRRSSTSARPSSRCLSTTRSTVTSRLSVCGGSAPTRPAVLVSSWLPCTTVNTAVAATLPTSLTTRNRRITTRKRSPGMIMRDGDKELLEGSHLR